MRYFPASARPIRALLLMDQGQPLHRSDTRQGREADFNPPEILRLCRAMSSVFFKSSYPLREIH